MQLAVRQQSYQHKQELQSTTNLNKERVAVGFAEYELRKRPAETRKHPHCVRYHCVDVFFWHAIKVDSVQWDIKCRELLIEAKDDVIWLDLVIPVAPNK